MDRRIQIVRRGDKSYFRAEPITAKYPTKGQIMSRIRFGEIAKKAKGKKFKGDLPPAAEIVKREMSGAKFARKRRLKKWELILLEEAKKQGKEKFYRKILLGGEV